MSEWKEFKLGKISKLVSERVNMSHASLENYISTENMINDFGGVKKAEKLPVVTSVNRFSINDILFSNIRTYFKKVWLSSFNGTVSPDVLVFRAEKDKCLDKYLYYSLCNSEFTQFSVLTSRGAKMPRGDKDALLNYPILLPTLLEQTAITSILSSLDDKINLLRIQNQTLDQIAETLFRQWFVENPDTDWEERPLSSVATFLNGLACQKYPPKNEVDKLPVLKIKELRNGISEDCDWCSNEIDEKYIIKNGDVIFSWSASLMVKIWDGETCILNQHLFKVDSDEFPKWYFYLWSRYHLDQFISIATAHATTMGHIKRGDLDEAMVLLPSKEEIEDLGNHFEPILGKLIENNKQIRTLTSLRDTLLPKLMSGEIRIV